MPLMIVVYGEFTTLLVDRDYRVGTTSKTVLLSLFNGGKILTNATVEENRVETINDSISYGILMTLVATLQFLAGIFSIDLFNYTALKQITRIRHYFFRSLLRQEIGCDIEKIKEGIAEKVSHFLCLVIGFLICVALSFAYGWKLTLVVIVYVPLLLVTNMIVTRFQTILTAREINAYSIASNVVEEVLSGIRTVVAFGGERKEVKRYAELLIPAQEAGARKGLSSGIGEGIMRFMFYASNALAYWYGVQLILADRDKVDKEYTPSVLMITFFGLIVGAENIAKTAPFLECFAAARGSALTIFQVIDRKSMIDPMSGDGKILNFGIKGDIEFKDVHFRYPSRTEVEVLRGLNLTIKSGETVALVGHSGNGKSTCLQLLQRFYDPTDGSIVIDNCDIRKFNIAWLRSNIAIVGQEPVLFATTIENNIRYGRPDATRKEIEDAARDSGAHDFIIKLSEGYQTNVGERGCQLSGGQKQRIAIARAIIQNPKILLLDEATSALDTQSEKYVQEAIDRASKGRTTIVVSHRLSAIRAANRILFIDKGQVIEDGSPDDLLEMKGFYYQMVKAGSFESLDDENVISKSNDKEVYRNEKTIEKILLSDELALSAHGSLEKVSATPKIEENIQYWDTLCRILLVARPEWLFLVIAILAAILIGGAFPGFAVLLGEFYGALALADPVDASERTNMLCILFVVMGVVMGVGALIQTHLFNLASVYLSTRIRSMAFEAMINQEMAWFDESENSVGALSARLTGDASSVQGAIGYPLSGILQAISTFAVGLGIAFIFSWKLSLLCFSAVPIVIFCVIFEAKYMTSTAAVEKSATEEATRIATEAIVNIRTVASLRQEPDMISRFCNEMKNVEKLLLKKYAFRGLVNSSGQSIPFYGYAAALYVGGLLVADGEIHFKNIIKVSEALLYGAIMLGQSLAFAPSFTAAFISGHRMFKIIDRQSRLKSQDTYDSKPGRRGDVSYKGVEFRYPSRPDIQILTNFDLKIFEGKTVALVGPSGSGKSTCVQLLQRLYDPDNGQIRVGGDEISTDISVSDLRRKLGIVSQEPILFDRTISENIAYGDNTRVVEMTDIIEAAKMANIHTFIASLPMGYETSANGTQLSGGQKQRIAIARSLIRNPKILILDEATSALDLQSEKIVQAALDLARTGRTCIVIAHRLSTVQNADLICVIQNGQVFEQGTHNQLMTIDGLYAKLYQTQPLAVE